MLSATGQNQDVPSAEPEFSSVPGRPCLPETHHGADTGGDNEFPVLVKTGAAKWFSTLEGLEASETLSLP